MSNLRIEGSLWQALPEEAGRESAAQPEARQFAQLMSMAAAEMSGSRGSSTSNRRNTQRYRLIGSQIEGVVCEIGERDDGGLHLTVQVPDDHLFETLAPLSSWLSERLFALGYPILLEVAYVKPGNE